MQHLWGQIFKMKIIKQIKGIFTIISTMLLGMTGGQKSKGARRFGIPGLALTLNIGKKFKLKHLAYFLLIPILCMGYGENSFLMGVFNSDFIVRIVYGFLVSIPFIFFGIKRWFWTAGSLIIAFIIRAGALGSINGFDFLVEDMIRYGVLGFWIAVNTFKGEK